MRDTRLLAVDPRRGTIDDARVGDLARYLRAGDVLVLNDAATLPASFAARTHDGAEIELRIARIDPRERFTAVLFGAGDWRTPTEHRSPPPALRAGDPVIFGDDLHATIVATDARHPRLVTIVFDRRGDALWRALYARGRPVQYAYVRAPLPLWRAQTLAATRPWAVECPSAALPIDAALVRNMREHGVTVATLTHGAGLSSTGDPALDARFPLPEHYAIPTFTADAITRATGRIVAVGTTVVRALEASFMAHGRITAGEGIAENLVGIGTPLNVVDGLFTGMHEPGTSHFALLGAFADEALLARAWAESESLGYLAHEFGDTALWLAA